MPPVLLVLNLRTSTPLTLYLRSRFQYSCSGVKPVGPTSWISCSGLPCQCLLTCLARWKCEQTGNWLSTVVRVVLWFHATFPTLAEFPDIYSGGTVLSLAVPMFFFCAKVGEADILDEFVWESRRSWIRQGTGQWS